ncbi:hypothetical protein CVT26_012338 [Gymnopilus dilepis]|uniref:Uncharacterized protein n=1 Tax=Gymnopilus dilepis TaxID=231916 RepID=A0A409YQ27_9AGAR|nr:hypothetical protein CVT26_012338 [Gymnopilus dilepis]
MCAICLKDHSSQNAACQKKDWRVHKGGCMNSPESDGPAFHTIRSYDFRFMDGYLSFALTRLELWRRYHHLTREDFLKEWSQIAGLYFLHVYLVRVKNPPPGRFNHVQYHSVRMSSLFYLVPSLRERIQQRLEARSPAFTIGYSIIPGDINEGEEYIHVQPKQVEAFVHTFRFPLADTSNIDLTDILRGVAYRETAYREEACQKARDGKKK